MSLRIGLSTAALVVALSATSMTLAAEGGQGDVQQTIPPDVVSVIQPLALSDTQRERIKAVLAQKNTEVSFALKQAKSAKSFEPSVGVKIPKGLKPHAFPPPLIYEMPLLKRYSYLQFKDQTLIVNPMTKKIVEIVPQT
jgi:hypothetical protein